MIVIGKSRPRTVFLYVAAATCVVLSFVLAMPTGAILYWMAPVLLFVWMCSVMLGYPVAGTQALAARALLCLGGWGLVVGADYALGNQFGYLDPTIMLASFGWLCLLLGMLAASVVVSRRFERIGAPIAFLVSLLLSSFVVQVLDGSSAFVIMRPAFGFWPLFLRVDEGHLEVGTIAAP